MRTGRCMPDIASQYKNKYQGDIPLNHYARQLRNAVLLLCMLVSSAYAAQDDASRPVRNEAKAAGTGKIVFIKPSILLSDEADSRSVGDVAPTRITLRHKSRVINKDITAPCSGPVCKSPCPSVKGAAIFDGLTPGWYRWNTQNSCLKPRIFEAGDIKVEPGKCVAITVSSLWACPMPPITETK